MVSMFFNTNEIIIVLPFLYIDSTFSPFPNASGGTILNV